MESRIPPSFQSTFVAVRFVLGNTHSDQNSGNSSNRATYAKAR
jgi:hypothetical protein